jgi:asparagine N-glycosylation enzyme membrane subunit Stt3
MVIQLQVWAFWLFQEAEGISFDPRSVWGNMGVLAKLVVLCLFIMSICTGGGGRIARGEAG